MPWDPWCWYPCPWWNPFCHERWPRRRPRGEDGGRCPGWPGRACGWGGGGLGFWGWRGFLRWFLDPRYCADTKEDLLECRRCCVSADTAHTLVCMGFYGTGVGAFAAILCLEAALHWAMECEIACMVKHPPAQRVVSERVPEIKRKRYEEII